MPIATVIKKQHPAIFINHSVFGKPAWGNNHPLAISRQTALLDLCQILGWLNPTNTRICTPASHQTLIKFHHPDYVQAFADATSTGKVSAEVRARYQIGTMENPIFPGLFERAAATVGGAILAAELALEGRISFHPAGGTHHGRPDKASGFCYFNDPVFAIMTLLDKGCDRVAYVDIDAHHGDGVQDAFAKNSKVLCVSIHETDRWPYTGAAKDQGAGHARNFPVAKAITDPVYGQILHQKIIPMLNDFTPDAIVITCGADALDGDPLSSMRLSNHMLINTTMDLCNLAPAAVVLGGGGYNPWTTARLWTALWGRLSEQIIPEQLPPNASDILRQLSCDLIDEEDVEPHWLTRLLDHK